MPCSVTTSPISMKTCRKGHRWSKKGDAALSSSLFIRIQKNSSLTGAKHACFGSQRGGESSTSEAGLKKRLYVLLWHFQGLVEEPVPTAVWLQRLGCFFFSRKKKVLCAHGARAGCNSLARTRQSAPARWVLRFSDCRLVWRRVLVSQKCRRSQNFSFLLFKEKFQWACGVQ